MASTCTNLSRSLSISTHSVHNARPSSRHAHAPKHAHIPTRIASSPNGRRQWLLLLTATTALKALELPSKAQDIPLFGLRKKLKKVEEEAEEIVKEGFESAEKGLEAAEKGIETAEKGVEAAERGIETAEREIETALSFGGLAQAGAVAGAEFVGILVATSVVNGILGPEGQKS